MSDESRDDKQHKATPKRLGELRRKGTVMRSRDLTGGLVIAASVMQIIMFSTNFAMQFKRNYILSFNHIGNVLEYQDNFSEFIKRIATDNFALLLPVFCVAFVVVMLSPFLFGGWNFTLEAIQFKLEKLDPFANIKNIFSPMRAAGELVKSMLKAIVIISVLVLFFMTKKDQIISLLHMPVKLAIHSSYAIVIQFVMLLLFALVFLVIFDVFYSYFKFQKQTKMSLQEVKDEHKESEGSVEVKKKIRSVQFSLMKQRLSVTVPRAHVIITNPTHYSVALRYDNVKDKAPKVVAKGKGPLAHQIKLIAISNAVPIYEAPALARAVYHTTKIGFEIHPGLYMAVAIVLSYVNQLKSYQMGVGQIPKYVTDLEIPKEFIYNE